MKIFDLSDYSTSRVQWKNWKIKGGYERLAGSIWLVKTMLRRCLDDDGRDGPICDDGTNIARVSLAETPETGSGRVCHNVIIQERYALQYRDSEPVSTMPTVITVHHHHHHVVQQLSSRPSPQSDFAIPPCQTYSQLSQPHP